MNRDKQRMVRRTVWRMAVAMLCLPIASAASTVVMETPLGNIEIELFDDNAPQTVANFLRYVNDGDYAGSFIHRSVPGFIVQGGGFVLSEGNFLSVPQDPPVVNEFGLSNVRGTIAMAKLGGDPNSATSQWFFNLADNSANLDAQNGGFTVFGRVLGDGMRVVDLIASIRQQNFGNPFAQIPLIAYPGSGDVERQHLVTVEISEVADGFRIGPGLSGAWFNAGFNGQGWLIDVFETATGLQVFVAWFTYDVDAPDSTEMSDFGTRQHRWFTASGPVTGATAALVIHANSDGIFNDSRPTDIAAVGTMTLRFSDCAHGVLVFSFDGAANPSGEVAIERLTPNTFCIDH